MCGEGGEVCVGEGEVCVWGRECVGGGVCVGRGGRMCVWGKEVCNKQEDLLCALNPFILSGVL